MEHKLSINNKYNLKKVKLPNLIEAYWIDSEMLVEIVKQEKLIRLKDYKNEGEVTPQGITFQINNTKQILTTRQIVQSTYAFIFNDFNDFENSCIKARLRLSVEETPIIFQCISEAQIIKNLLLDYNPKQVKHRWTSINLYILDDNRVYFAFGTRDATVFNTMEDFEKYYKYLEEMEKNLEDYQ